MLDGFILVAGGIVGRSQGEDIIQNCINVGNVSHWREAGGIVGRQQALISSTISNCINYGYV